jgi:hypothetical protein
MRHCFSIGIAMKRHLTHAMCIVLCTCSLGLASGPAGAQGASKQEQSDVFSNIGQWFDRSITSIGDYFRSAGKDVDEFNRKAGAAARATAGAAVDAADTVARIPKTRVVSGHQSCPIADNGAPDCGSAADKLCRSHGLKSGASLGVTSARECPARALAGHREAKAECRDVTFVTRAVCR